MNGNTNTNLKHTLRTSTATAALLLALGAGAATAQATGDIDFGTPSIATAATHDVTNSQAAAAAVTASATGSTTAIDLVITSVSDDIVTAATPVTGNTFPASATANSGTASVVLSNPAFTSGDTAVAGNLQTNTANTSATASNNTFRLLVENDDTGVRTFTGAGTVDNNISSATADGNVGDSSIAVDPGIDIDENAAGQASVAIDSTLPLGTDSDSEADLLVTSGQEIDGATVQTTATVDNETVQAILEAVDGASISVSGNGQNASATGNDATNGIDATGATASITASAAVANLQRANSAAISADTTNSTITLEAGRESDTDITGDVAESTLTLDGNSQTSAATGNASSQTLGLTASNITGETAAASSSDSAAGSGIQLSATADAVIANVQLEENTPIGATTDGNTISLRTFAADTDVSTSSQTASANLQSASATGSSTANALTLEAGSTLSATGVVASVQNADNSVTAATTNNTILNDTGDDITDGTMTTTGNTQQAVATGGSASNTVTVADGTNNISLSGNVSTVLVNSAGTEEQPTAGGGYVITNDQARGAIASVTANTLDNQIVTDVGTDAITSSITTDGNTVSASATGQTADNAVSLDFNELQGGITGGGMVAATANEQDLAVGSTVTARTVGSGGIPVETRFLSDANASSVSTSDNTVAATARGNVTTANSVTADPTAMTIDDATATPTITAGTGVVSADGNFVAASSQVSAAGVLASLNNAAGTTSNLVQTSMGDDIEANSSVVSDDNTLSASATANLASNAVSLGSGNSANIQANGAVANYQGTDGQGTVRAEIGVTGTDPVAAYNSANNAPAVNSTITSGGGGVYTNTGATQTFTFADPLTPEEQAILADAGFTNITATSADWASGATISTSGRLGIAFTNPDAATASGDETLAITSFVATGAPATLNNAGVIIAFDDQMLGTAAVRGNTIVAEATGNNATNATSAEATSVLSQGGIPAPGTSINGSDTSVTPIGFDHVTANLQENASTLDTAVAGTFAITSDADTQTDVADSSRSVEGNLQQSYATANRATNTVALTATNATALTGVENAQDSSAGVTTSSDLDVTIEAASQRSALVIDTNTNQSVANGNVATNSTTVHVTNSTGLGTTDVGLNTGTGVISQGTDLLGNTQVSSASVDASAETDVFNLDNSGADNLSIIDGSVSMSGNATVAQATANNATNSVTLGTAGTANNERTAGLLNAQNASGGTVTASTDSEVELSLGITSTTAPLDSSSARLDDNASTALARANVATNTVTVDGANIDAGAGGDASYSDVAAAAQMATSFQNNAAGVSATSSQARVAVSMNNANGEAITGPTVSASGNTAAATAIGNTAVTTLDVGANGANVDASTLVGNSQNNDGAIAATGGSAVSVTANATADGNNGASASTITVANNASSADAIGNQTQNTLVVGGANITSGAATSASADLTGPAVLNAGNLLANDQTNSQTITSTNTANSVLINLHAAEVGGGAAAGDSSTLTLSGNSVEARATANLALNNSVNVGNAGTSTNDATALVHSSQNNTAAVSASASTRTVITASGADKGGTSATALNASSAIVENNSTLALARGNVVQNVLGANGATVSAGASPASLNSGAAISTASYLISNEQTQGGAVTATAADAAYEVRVSSPTGTALNASSAAMSGNKVDAIAYGNVATNDATLTSLNGLGNDASVGIMNTQSNSGAISATASGASIGVFSTGGLIASSASVSGNSVGATAVGNFGSSTVTRATR